MKIPLNPSCPELCFVESPALPQTHVDLCAIEYRRVQLGRERFRLALATYWAALIHHTLKQSRN